MGEEQDRVIRELLGYRTIEGPPEPVKDDGYRIFSPGFPKPAEPVDLSDGPNYESVDELELPEDDKSDSFDPNYVKRPTESSSVEPVPSQLPQTAARGILPSNRLPEDVIREMRDADFVPSEPEIDLARSSETEAERDLSVKPVELACTCNGDGTCKCRHYSNCGVSKTEDALRAEPEAFTKWYEKEIGRFAALGIPIMRGDILAAFEMGCGYSRERGVEQEAHLVQLEQQIAELRTKIDEALKVPKKKQRKSVR